MARATSSLPVPVSPEISTVESLLATLETCDRTAVSTGEPPTISSNIEVFGEVPQILFDHAGASGTILAWELANEAMRW